MGKEFGQAEDNLLKRGTLIRGIGSFYTVTDQEHYEYTVRCKKRFRHERITPLVGDEVMFSPGKGDEHGWLEEILTRKTVCLRPPVANVTMLVIIIAPVPEPDLLLTDRLIARVRGQGIKVLIAVNKSDIDPHFAEKVRMEYTGSKIPVIGVSALKKAGIDMLKDMLLGELSCFTGQSGAGKSTLLNAILGLNLETGDISRKTARGKNTTRHCELIEKDDIRVMDTAGFNLLEPENDLEPEKLKERYPEFSEYEGKCRFRECLHDKEPGCAVREAMENGMISQGRLIRYQSLLEEIRETWRGRYD